MDARLADVDGYRRGSSHDVVVAIVLLHGFVASASPPRIACATTPGPAMSESCKMS
jgi:hypothetical protein